MYRLKHNLPTKTFFSDERFSHKRDAMNRFRLIEKWCVKLGFPVKSFLRDDKRSSLRATMQTEIDGFFYYAELFRE